MPPKLRFLLLSCPLTNGLLADRCCCCDRVRDAQDTLSYRSKNVFLTKEQVLASAKQYQTAKKRLKKAPGEKVIRVRHFAPLARIATRTPYIYMHEVVCCSNRCDII